MLCLVTTWEGRCIKDVRHSANVTVLHKEKRQGPKMHIACSAPDRCGRQRQSRASRYQRYERASLGMLAPGEGILTAPKC